MISDEEIVTQANYYLDNDVTMEEAGEYFGVCKKTFQLRMKKLASISPFTYNLVKIKKELNLVLGASKGGKNGKPTVLGLKRREKNLTSEEAVSLAHHMLENDLSLREIEQFTGIPKSTIFDSLSEENLGNELFGQIKEMYESHKPQNKIY